MVKYLALAAALVVSLVAVDMAQAGRRCKSCCGGGGCPGGVCHVEVVPVAPTAAVTNAPPVAVVRTEVAPAPAAAPQYYTSARRGLFGWRR
jgi:hypothetical protein